MELGRVDTLAFFNVVVFAEQTRVWENEIIIFTSIEHQNCIHSPIHFPPTNVNLVCHHFDGVHF